MIFLKAITVVVAGLLTLVAVKQMVGQLTAARARARVQPARRPDSVTRLRQDPRSGIYYPEK